MISEIDFANIKESKNFSYATKLDFFKNNTRLEFQPGLNVIFAPNGSGKSTILKMMAQFTASEQGGVSTVTQGWIMDVSGFKNDSLQGIEVKHDGQAVVYANPRNAVGLLGGQFDDDFFDQGLGETMMRESTGITTMARMNLALSVLLGKACMPDITYKRKTDEYTESLLKARIEKGNRTILLDEPESGLGLHVQRNIWHAIEKGAIDHNLQVIVATHSPFALALTHAHYIELQPGYMKTAKDSIISAANMIKLMDELEKTEKETKSNKPG